MNFQTFMEKFNQLVKENKLNVKEKRSLAMMIRRGICINALQECNSKSLLILGTPSFFKNNRLVSEVSYVKRVQNWAINSPLAIKLYNELSQIHLSQKDIDAIAITMYNME